MCNLTSRWYCSSTVLLCCCTCNLALRTLAHLHSHPYEFPLNIVQSGLWCNVLLNSDHQPTSDHQKNAKNLPGTSIDWQQEYHDVKQHNAPLPQTENVTKRTSHLFRDHGLYSAVIPNLFSMRQYPTECQEWCCKTAVRCPVGFALPLVSQSPPLPFTWLHSAPLKIILSSNVHRDSKQELQHPMQIQSLEADKETGTKM